ncbi:endonuclease/exonuclease/phosphatase family protein [Pyruvatibacter mobilis]|uniref:endonuclease/exonuclease/phosphatase family protein n=1 Tax=Pyruvatibacter mobilis TaxID=1712261 RepID=UPI003BAAA052
MKIIAWNLNHRTRPRALPKAICRFIESYAPDLITLNEFVDAPDREGFYDDLRELGYAHLALSEPTAGNNQILAASREPMERGTAEPPQYDTAAYSNFLHVYLPGEALHVVGLRAPAYSARAKKADYWAEVGRIADKLADDRTILLGDLNYDPFRGIDSTRASADFTYSRGYSIPSPTGAWSYVSSDGRRTSRIDHAVVSSSLTVQRAEYISTWDDIDVPPILSSTVFWSPIPRSEEVGREEAVHGRADHRVLAGGGERHPGQGAVPPARLLAGQFLSVAQQVRGHVCL